MDAVCSQTALLKETSSPFFSYFSSILASISFFLGFLDLPAKVSPPRGSRASSGAWLLPPHPPHSCGHSSTPCIPWQACVEGRRQGESVSLYSSRCGERKHPGGISFLLMSLCSKLKKIKNKLEAVVYGNEADTANQVYRTRGQGRCVCLLLQRLRTIPPSYQILV